MKAQFKEISRQQDAIMKRFREAKKKVQDAGKDVETVYETEMKMIRNFNMRSKSPSPLPPSGEKACTTGVHPVVGSGQQMPPRPNPPPGHTAPKDQPPQPKRDGYVDFFRRALRSLGGDTRVNREMGVFSAIQELELEMARAEK
jgi:hypothetical protein